MGYENFDHFASGLSSLATILALMVGGWWAYSRFVRTREAWPKIEFSVEIEFVCKHGGFWLIEAIAHVDNKGQVRHSIKEFTFDIRYMLASDHVEARVPFLVHVPHKASEGSWLPWSKSSEGSLIKWNETFIEPGVRTRYSCVATIPEEATVAMIHGKFFYESSDWHTSDKLVAVPAKHV